MWFVGNESNLAFCFNVLIAFPNSLHFFVSSWEIALTSICSSWRWEIMTKNSQHKDEKRDNMNKSKIHVKWELQRWNSHKFYKLGYFVIDRHCKFLWVARPRRYDIVRCRAEQTRKLFSVWGKRSHSKKLKKIGGVL